MQVFANKEKLGRLSKTSNTTVQLTSSVLTIGAKQYSTSTLSCDLTTSGTGGIDTGSIESDTKYYIYAVFDVSTVKLIASKSEIKPLTFSVFKKIGFIVTDYLSIVIKINEENRKTYWQRKDVTSVDTSTGQVAQLTFDNLEIGKTYRVSGLIRVQSSGSSATATTASWVGDVAGTKNLGFVRSDGGSYNLHIGQGAGFVFTAGSTTAYVTISRNASSSQVQAGSNLSLEELPDHEETSRWT